MPEQEVSSNQVEKQAFKRIMTILEKLDDRQTKKVLSALHKLFVEED